MKNLSMISKPQTGYTVKKVNARKDISSVNRSRSESFERFVREHNTTNVYYIGVNGGALVQPAA